MKSLKHTTSALMLIGCLSATYTHAAVRVLDFDHDANGNVISNGQIVDDEYSAWGITIESCNTKGPDAAGTDRINGECGTGDFAGRQVAFDTLEDPTEDTDLEFEYNATEKRYFTELTNQKYPRLGRYKDFYQERYAKGDSRRNGWKSPGNVMILHEQVNECGTASTSLTVCNNPDDEASRPNGFFVFKFKSPVDILNIDFFDLEPPGEVSDAVQPKNKMYFFYADGSPAQSTQVQAPGNNNYSRLNFETTTNPLLTSIYKNVTKLVVNMPGSGAINNLVVREVSAPAALSLFIIGLAFVGLRRKQ